MDMKKRTRKALTYKVHRFFEQLELNDIIKAIKLISGDIAAGLTILLIFGIIFLLPHFFH